MPDRDVVSIGDDVSGARTRGPKTESTPLGDKLRVLAVSYKSSGKDDWAAGLAQAADIVDEDAHLLQGRAFVDALDRMLAARLELFVESIAADVVAAIHDTAASSPPPAMPKTKTTKAARAPHVAFQRAPEVVAVGQKTARAIAEASDGAVGVRRVLIAVAQHMPDGVNAAQLSLLTGYKKTTRDLYVRRAVASGWVQKHGAQVLATRAGERELGPGFERLPTGDALLRHWLGRLKEGPRRVLSYVATFYPHPVSSEQITRATSYKKTTRDLYVRKLKSWRLLEPTGKSHVQASPMLFDPPQQAAGSS